MQNVDCTAAHLSINDTFNEVCMLDISVWESIPATNRSWAFRKKIYGVGVTDVDFVTATIIDGKQVVHPAAISWRKMLASAYSDEHRPERPSQNTITVCNEWHLFSNFLSWWKLNYVDGWVLNKDLLTDSSVCSPLTCLYAPKWLHAILRSEQRGKLMPGVTITSSGKFQAICAIPKNGGGEYLGSFDTEIDAHLAWMRRKLEHVLHLKADMDAIDARIYPRMTERIKTAR